MIERPSSAANAAADAAEALIAGGQATGARRMFRRALELEPDNARAATGLTRLLLSAGDFSSAVALATTTLNRNPDDARLLVLHADIGMALYRGRLWEEAKPWLARAAAAEPWNTAVTSAYARACGPDQAVPDV